MKNETAINRIMLAGTHSGCGKTTVTCALLKALLNRGMNLASFKCGPDYIDPMFHTKILKAYSRNIDPYLCGEAAAASLFAENSRGRELSVVEGVMGFYDGLGGNTSGNSSWEISQKLEIPVVLVVDCKGASLSVAATIKGFLEFHENRIQGVILNRVSAPSYPMYREMIEEHTGVKVLGYLPFSPKAAIESRHLGLVTADEITSLEEKIEALGHTAETTLDIPAILNLAAQAPAFVSDPISVAKEFRLRIAVARDEAFCFYYEDSLALLRLMGAELIPFSPLHNQELPENCSGLILGGGYPELYLEQLGGNTAMLESIRRANENKMPFFAECGGFMYLGKAIDGVPMTGVIPMESSMTKRLQNFGYVELTALADSCLMDQGERIKAHEFHYSKSDIATFCLQAEKNTGKSWGSGYATETLFALYPHLHFWGGMDLARKFLAHCETYRREKDLL